MFVHLTVRQDGAIVITNAGGGGPMHGTLGIVRPGERWNGWKHSRLAALAKRQQPIELISKAERAVREAVDVDGG